jgi:SAM-dependent methyltransferase
LLAAQVPWLGRRIASGTLDSGVDWLHGGVAKSKPIVTATLDRLSHDWEDLADVDPLWAILSDPTKRNGRWDLAEFLASGKAEIERALARGGEFGYPKELGQALDFGCGVGRLTRAMAAHFRDCVGVDISESMVKQATEMNRDVGNCSFRVNQSNDLRMFEDQRFDLIYSNIVLQHVPDPGIIEEYVSEFARTLSVGGLLVFQLPSHVPLRYRLEPRRRLYHVLRALGIPASVLQRRFALYPITMTAIPKDRVIDLLGRRGLNVLEVEQSEIAGFGITSQTYWAGRV